MDKKSVNKARSIYYGLMSKMFVFSSDEDRYDDIVEVLNRLIEAPLDENSGEALKEIRDFIQTYGSKKLSLEYDELFSNPETKIIRDTASFYDESVESGKKRVIVKNFLGKTKIRRDEKRFKDNEDSIGFLVTFMHELTELIIQGELQYESVAHCLFEEVINEFIDEFIADLYEHNKANAYKSLAIVLNAFITFERMYFEIQKPKPKETMIKKEEPCEFISDKEAQRRAENRIKKAANSLVTSCSLEDAFEVKEEKLGDL